MSYSTVIVGQNDKLIEQNNKIINLLTEMNKNLIKINKY